MFSHSLQKLLLFHFILSPMPLLGLILMPLAIATLLKPPSGHELQHPRTAQDYIERANDLLKPIHPNTTRSIEALQMANKAVELAPKNGDALVCRAYAKFELGRTSEAIADLYLARGKYIQIGQIEEARRVDTIYLPQLQRGYLNSIHSRLPIAMPA